MATLTELTRPVVRRIGLLVVRMDAEGIQIRGYRRRSGRGVSWARLAYFAEVGPLVDNAEERIGARELIKMGATTEDTESTEGEDDASL